MTENQVDVKLGVTFDLDGQAILLKPEQSINQIKKEGIDLYLPEKLNLGTVERGINGIVGSFGVKDFNVEEIGEKLPDFKPLKDAYNKALDAEITVEEFHVKLPGSGRPNQPKQPMTYTIGLSATWLPDGDPPEEQQGLTMTGIYFMVSNEGFLSRQLEAAD
jgi:hypothetical protein